MTDEAKATLMVVTSEAPAKTTMRGSRDEVRRIVEEGVPVEKLKESFAHFMDCLRQIVEDGYQTVGEFDLDEITFKAEIGANGEFKLLGTGVGVNASSGVTFTLHRKK